MRGIVIPLMLTLSLGTQALAADPVAGWDLPWYPAARLLSDLGTMETNGVPLTAIVAVTSDDADTVWAHLERSISEHTDNPIQHRKGKRGGYLGYLHPDTGDMHLVTLAPGKSGLLLIYSRMKPAELLETDQQVPKDLPQLPGATSVVINTDRQGNLRHRTVSYLLPGRFDMDQVLRELSQAAELQGWQKMNEPPIKSGAGLLLQNRTHSLNLLVRKRPHGTAVIMTAIGKDSSP